MEEMLQVFTCARLIGNLGNFERLSGEEKNASRADESQDGTRG
jgi:hypothetical protein